MKTPSLDLFNFIHSMSSAEKRYFKKDTRDSNTLDLFDIINEMEAYDEELVKSRLKDSSYAGNLKVHKNRLQQILLKNLRSFHEEKSAQSRIKVLIDNSEIYLKKKLYEQALTQLDKAIQYCENFEEYELKLQALSIKSRLSSYTGFVDDFEHAALSELEICANQIQNNIHHSLVNKKIYNLINATSSSKKELIEKVEIIIEESNQKGQKPISNIAERTYLYSLAMLSNLKGDIRTACQLTLKIVNKFESNPFIVEEKNLQYLNCIINYLNFCCKLPEARIDVEKYIEKAENHCSMYEHLQPNMLYIYFSYLECLRRERNFETICALYELKIKDLIANFHLDSSFLAAKSLLITIEAYLANLHFEQAAELLNMLQNLKQNIPNDFKMSVYIVELLYYYSKFDLESLSILILNLQKKIRKLFIESRFVENLLTLFQNISKANISDHKNLFQLYRTSLSTYAEDIYFNQLNNYIEFASWLDAQIRKKPYSLVLKEKSREIA